MDKIIVDARFLTKERNGILRYSLSISLELQKLFGDKVIFVSSNDIKYDDYKDMLSVEIIGTHTGFLWEQWDLPRYLLKLGRPKLLSLFGIPPILYSNKYTTIHDITYIRFPKTFSKKFVWFYKTFIPLVIRTSKHIFTVSDFSKKEIISYYKVDPKKISVTWNAVDESFKLNNSCKRYDELYILVLASGRNKNLKFVIDVFERLNQLYPDLKLILYGNVGTDVFRENNIKVDRNLIPKISILGKVSEKELIDLYYNACFFLFPTKYEGFGIPVIEAQTCKCPVIASDAASMPEVLAQSAILVSNEDISFCVESAKKLIEDEAFRSEIISKGIENVKRFSWANSAKQIANVLL